MPNSVVLEVFTDFVCPWCYLATPRVERLRQNYDVDVQWTYFPLHPETPVDGMLLKDLFAGRNFDLEAAHLRLKTLMDAEGLIFNQRSHTYNSRLAQELAKGFDSGRLRELNGGRRYMASQPTAQAPTPRAPAVATSKPSTPLRQTVEAAPRT